MKEKISRIQDLVGLLHALYPPALAESWDNVGLQVGEPQTPVSRALVCLDPSAGALAEASRAAAQALVCHHPLIYTPLRSLVPVDETGRLLFQAVRDGIAILAAHTNLDRARDGLNDWLAEALGVEEAVPLQTGADDLLKLVVYVPAGYEKRVADALFQAGAGHIGNYDCCSFRSEGTGTFRPGSGSDPFSGSVGEQNSVRELRMETILPKERMRRVVDRMVKAHPYEEVAYDLIPLVNRRTEIGLGRIGILPRPTTLASFAEGVKQALSCPALRLVGAPDRKVQKVALCGGSGSSLLAEAVRQGADVLVTGDVKYHDARNAENQNLALIDAGHFASEQLMVGRLAEVLRRKAAERGMHIEFLEYKGEEDPFTVI
ncbi:MAG: Nif3-like dinuclear metal center hexameric protein [Syntrophotaleaceae bacterium]